MTLVALGSERKPLVVGLAALLLGAAAGFSEEMLFRGVMQVTRAAAV